MGIVSRVSLLSFECLTFLEYMTSTVLCDKRDLKHGLDNVVNDLKHRLRSVVNLYPEGAKIDENGGLEGSKIELN